jgi:hypothetical protein
VKRLIEILVFSLAMTSVPHSGGRATSYQSAQPEFLLRKAGSRIDSSEQNALQISAEIQARHMPNGVLIDPIFASPYSKRIIGYTRAGDSAIWTGHYLAAEAFRYRVTGSSEAFENVKNAVAAIQSLVDVTGNNLLARCLIPVNWRFAQSIVTEEAHHGIYRSRIGGKDYYWIGNTSRDQYSGVFFGLGVAYEMVEDQNVREAISSLVTRLLEYLINRNWSVMTPDGFISTTFIARLDQRLSFLQIGRQMNPSRFSATYRVYRFLDSGSVSAPIAFDLLSDHKSYFKFNLNTINLYNLIRLESDGFYKGLYLTAYNLMRRTTDDHGNAHFNMIDRALKGPESRRDRETIELLAQWLSRSRRDQWVDWRVGKKYRLCGDDRACDPLPIEDRIRTDFLWQRSPYLLYGGGFGRIETAGIDFILPYWMARYYGVIKEKHETNEK